MLTPESPVDTETLPISCTVCAAQERVISPGWVWGFSPARCHVQSPLFASPGMVVRLFLQVPGRRRFRLEGLVTWACESEFGVELLHRTVCKHEERVTP